MNINYCLKCPYLSILRYNDKFKFTAKYVCACRVSQDIEKNMGSVKVLFDIDYDGKINTKDINEKCPSKLEHMFLKDDIKKFSKNGCERIDAFYKKGSLSSKKRLVDITDEGPKELL